jgi:endonuclease I
MPNHSDINIEHTWPQSRFSSRASKTKQKSDLHHLYPTNSRANSKRGNLKFGDFPDNTGPLRNCDISQTGTIKASGKQGFEPPTDHKGNVARALFYFSLRYSISMEAYEEVTMRLWNALDPVDEEEIRRNNIIEQLQGNRNPFIDDSSYADLITDF